MAPWEKGKRHESWASNGNVSVYIFFLLFISWLVFQVWARFGGGPPPTGLDPMVMAALGVAITSKSVEKKQQDRAQAERINDLEKLAKKTHPESAKEIIAKDSDDDVLS